MLFVQMPMFFLAGFLLYLFPDVAVALFGAWVALIFNRYQSK